MRTSSTLVCLTSQNKPYSWCLLTRLFTRTVMRTSSSLVCLTSQNKPYSWCLCRRCCCFSWLPLFSWLQRPPPQPPLLWPSGTFASSACPPCRTAPTRRWRGWGWQPHWRRRCCPLPRSHRPRLCEGPLCWRTERRFGRPCPWSC